MEGNFAAVQRKEWCRTDLIALMSELNDHESLVRLKRRWLMDLPLPMSEQKWVEEILPPNDKMIPESVLREDDVSYEDIKTCIEKGFGAKNQKELHFVQKDVQVFNSRNSLRDALTLLDNLDNSSLYSIIMTLMGGTAKFEKTRSSMRRLIRRLLQNIIADKNGTPEKKLKQVFQLLKDQKFFCRNPAGCSTTSEAYRAAAVKVLDGLDVFPYRTLIAMRRKLRGVQGYVPSMQSPRCGKGYNALIRLVKKQSMEMLSNLGEADEPAERLAGALGIAGLTLKLIMNHSAVRDFRKFSPEIEALQNDMAKAIHLLDDTRRVSLIELKKVQHLLDPDSRLSVRSLRMAVRNLLTEYLFECSDMDKVPDCILQTLDIINRRSQLPTRKKSSTSKVYSSSPQELIKEVIQKEVECVLNVSAQAKEVALNSLPGHDFDENFAHAYVEDFGGSDSPSISEDDDGYERVVDISQHEECHPYNARGETESVGEADPGDLSSSDSASESDDCSSFPKGMSDAPLDSNHVTQIDPNETCSSVHSQSCKESKTLGGHQCTVGKKFPSGCNEEARDCYFTPLKAKIEQNLSSRSCSPDIDSRQKNLISDETAIPKFVLSDFPVEEANNVSQLSGSGNQYLEFQEACDVTSMVAYRVIGHVLDKLAKAEGLELYQGDRLYLRTYASVAEDCEESPHALSASEFSEIWRGVLHHQ